jgi:hypothetical protein
MLWLADYLIHNWRIPRGRGLHTTPPQPPQLKEERLTRFEVFHDLHWASSEGALSWPVELAAPGHSLDDP